MTLLATLKNKTVRIRDRMAAHRRERQLQAFMAEGCKPWTPGYDAYKWDAISALILSGKSFREALGTDRFGYRIDERIVEYGWLFDRLPAGPGVMLDAGSALNHWVVIHQPKLREKKLFISTLASEGTAFIDHGISYIYEDLRETCFREEMFDYISCISTIEHVGLDNAFLYTDDKTKAEHSRDSYLPFLDVLRSRLRPGASLYLTFPYGKFRDHGWFQVFDAAMLSCVIERFAPSRYTEDIFQYKNDAWSQSTREEAADATCFDINVQKYYDSDCAAFSRAVACLELVR